jgi:N utilization substance protein A
VVRELEGEKIDVLRYDPDPRIFIKNALLPAEVKQVIVVDEPKKSALAIVADNQFSLAIGKQGLNVRLANRLVDWNIDVKTEQQFAEMDLSAETKRAVSALFGEVEEEIEKISELPDIPENIVEVLKKNGIELIEELVSMTKDEIAALDGIDEEDAALVSKIISENVEIVEEEQEVAVEAEDSTERAEAEAGTAPSEVEATPARSAPTEAQAAPTEAESAPAEAAPTEAEAEAEAAATAGEKEREEETEPEEEAYECPECGARITTDMTACPNCGVGLSFEEEEEEEE